MSIDNLRVYPIMKSTNKKDKCKNSKKRPSSLLLVPLCLLLPIWLLVTMPYYMSRNIYSRLKAILIRSESTLITSQVSDPMDEEDEAVLFATKHHLERTFKLDQIPEYDDPLY